ncbi:CsfB protein [Clostridium butyricum]|nr:CsfB protein [Clostridium butyricum]
MKKCFICGQINCDGIIINGEMICRNCEEKIVNTKVDDSDYDELKDSIKIILFDECKK